MLHEQKSFNELLAWLEKAYADITSSELLLSTGIKSQLHQVLFHSQQAVEKSLKAFLLWNQISFRRTHDLAEIGDQCAQLDKTLENIIEGVKYLSDYAWEYRYPGEDSEPKVSEAKAGLKAARKIFQEILVRLPSEVQSKFSKDKPSSELRKIKKKSASRRQK